MRRLPHATSKFAIRGFTQSLAREFAGTGISVSVVHPGGIKTSIAMKAGVAAAMPAHIARAAVRVADSCPVPDDTRESGTSHRRRNRQAQGLSVDRRRRQADRCLRSTHTGAFVAVIGLALAKAAVTTPFTC
ncbi:SDR family NAD(P)-dependent oxidoreductase [Rhodococcus qingshengii]|uniref:SDR family NAD(P)-dependent oxidoreductase n=1 Tax=Rhodococcus qingshengii TaxID=334542 RepID=UPI003D096284